MITEVTRSAGFGAVEDLAVSIELLQGAAEGRWPAKLYRAYRPSRTVAFTMRERNLPGFDHAWEAASAGGFTPALRRTGGRVAAYDDSCLIIDLIEPADVSQNHSESFGQVASAIDSALRGLGVDSRVGPIAGEYCPGEFSVGARGVVKLVGISQRVSRGARLISSVIAIEPAPQLARVLKLALDFGAAVAPGGSLLLAGLLTTQERAVRRACTRGGFRLAARIVRGDWSILWLRKRRTSR